jgi:hypothetical protein
VRIDRSDPADGSDDAYSDRRAGSTPDDHDAADKDRGTAVTGEGARSAYPARPDSALLTERTAAHRAQVNAVYRQYDIDHGQARDLPKGYKSAPALKGDPYHPDSVAARSTANQELYAATSRDRAATLGYTTRISAQKAPFDSHGQEVFTNGKSYITPDVDGHNVTNGWKMFNRRGVRIGTYNSELNYVKE